MRSIPQIEAILSPFSEKRSGDVEPDEEHTVDDALAFIAQFQGL